MLWFVILTVVLLSVAFTVFFGPPYLPTLSSQMETALDLLDLKPGQTLLELGSGDGRVLVAAARRGLNVVGIELSPMLAFVSWLRTRRFGGRVRIICGNYFMVNWPKADGIFTFMINRQMAKLDKRIETYRHGRKLRLASVAFKIPHKAIKSERKGVFLYEYR